MGRCSALVSSHPPDSRNPVCVRAPGLPYSIQLNCRSCPFPSRLSGIAVSDTALGSQLLQPSGPSSCRCCSRPAHPAAAAAAVRPIQPPLLQPSGPSSRRCCSRPAHPAAAAAAVRPIQLPLLRRPAHPAAIAAAVRPIQLPLLQPSGPSSCRCCSRPAHPAAIAAAVRPIQLPLLQPSGPSSCRCCSRPTNPAAALLSCCRSIVEGGPQTIVLLRWSRRSRFHAKKQQHRSDWNFTPRKSDPNLSGRSCHRHASAISSHCPKIVVSKQIYPDSYPNIQDDCHLDLARL